MGGGIWSSRTSTVAPAALIVAKVGALHRPAQGHQDPAHHHRRCRLPGRCVWPPLPSRCPSCLPVVPLISPSSSCSSSRPPTRPRAWPAWRLSHSPCMYCIPMQNLGPNLHGACCFRCTLTSTVCNGFPVRCPPVSTYPRLIPRRFRRPGKVSGVTKTTL